MTPPNPKSAVDILRELREWSLSRRGAVYSASERAMERGEYESAKRYIGSAALWDDILNWVDEQLRDQKVAIFSQKAKRP